MRHAYENMVLFDPLFLKDGPNHCGLTKSDQPAGG